jgi:hypothetical protein
MISRWLSAREAVSLARLRLSPVPWSIGRLPSSVPIDEPRTLLPVSCQAVGLLDQLGQPSCKTGCWRTVNDLVVDRDGDIEKLTGLQIPVNVAGLRGDAANGDHQGGRGNGDTPTTRRAEHPNRADPDGSAKPLEPFRVPQYEAPGQRAYRPRQAEERQRGLVAPLRRRIVTLAGPDLARKLLNALRLADRISNDWTIRCPPTAASIWVLTSTSSNMISQPRRR